MKNLLGSGCFIYPVESLCIKFFSWSNYLGAKELSISAEIFNKSWYSYSGELSKESYTQNFNWLSTWFERVKIEIFELFLTILFIIIITFALFNLKPKKIYPINIYFKDFKIILMSIFIFSVLIFFIKNPVIRMNHYTIISLMILIISLTFNFNIINHKKKFINIFLIIGIIFNLTKNIQRIFSNNFINNPYSMISQKVGKQEEKKIDAFSYYIGWYGEAPVASQKLENKNYKKKFIFNIIF